MSTGEVACSYAAMILHDEGIPITADKIATLVKCANINVEAYWPNLFAKLAERKDLGELTSNVGCGGGGAAAVAMVAPAAAATAAAPAAAATAAAPAAEVKKEEPEEESDDDMGISLFDD